MAILSWDERGKEYTWYKILKKLFFDLPAPHSQSYCEVQELNYKN